MSRHELAPLPGAHGITRGVIGWDRPLQTFFAQLFRTDAEGEEVNHLLRGSYPGELGSAAQAIALVAHACIVPAELGVHLETERLASLGTFDTGYQADMKARFVRRPSPSGDD